VTIFLDRKGVSRFQIKEYCCDMSPAFISGIENNFPEASITFAKFHVMKLVNEALDKVRHQEQTIQPELKHSRYVWLKNQENLTEKQKNKYAKLKDLDLATGLAYRMILVLQEMLRRSRIISEMYFDEWYNRATCSQLVPMIKLAQSIKNHEAGYFKVV